MTSQRSIEKQKKTKNDQGEGGCNLFLSLLHLTLSLCHVSICILVYLLFTYLFTTLKKINWGDKGVSQTTGDSSSNGTQLKELPGVKFYLLLFRHCRSVLIQLMVPLRNGGGGWENVILSLTFSIFGYFRHPLP